MYTSVVQWVGGGGPAVHTILFSAVTQSLTPRNNPKNPTTKTRIAPKNVCPELEEVQVCAFNVLSGGGGEIFRALFLKCLPLLKTEKKRF